MDSKRQQKIQKFEDQSFEFKFDSHFDQNGAFYYLGTKGLQKPYENPYKSNQISIFS